MVQNRVSQKQNNIQCNIYSYISLNLSLQSIQFPYFSFKERSSLTNDEMDSLEALDDFETRISSPLEAINNESSSIVDIISY